MAAHKSVLELAHRALNRQLGLAQDRAQAALAAPVPYVLGAKTLEAIDCSGLTSMCYPNLPDGVEKQLEVMRQWVFKDHDQYLVEPGDLLFLATQDRPRIPSHVGFVSTVDHGRGLATIVHASERIGSVTADNWTTSETLFKRDYIILGCGKIRPLLFRLFLEVEIKRELKNVLR